MSDDRALLVLSFLLLLVLVVSFVGVVTGW